MECPSLIGRIGSCCLFPPKIGPSDFGSGSLPLQQGPLGPSQQRIVRQADCIKQPDVGEQFIGAKRA
jgi:hypothetical protein